MSRASINTGGIVFGTDEDQRSAQEHPTDDAGMPLHILLMADLGGTGSRRETPLNERKILEINRDNFDQRFSSLNVALKLPHEHEPLCFAELDHLHPDYLYSHSGLFHQLHVLKQQLADPATFNTALQQITGEDTPVAPALFDQLLAGAQSGDSHNLLDQARDPDALIRSIVAPFIEPAEDPRAAPLIASVEQASQQALRKLMHQGGFKRLEANWRALDFLCRNIQSGAQLKLFVLDISEAELREQFNSSNDITETEIYRRTVSEPSQPGGVPYSVLLSDITLQDRVEDIRVAAGLSALAVYSDGIALISGSERIAGCESLSTTPDPRDWTHQPDTDFLQLWSVLRAEPQAESLLIAAPRFLLRLPYGAKTAPLECLAFEELDHQAPHENYLWSPGAYLAALLIANTFEQNYWDFNDRVLNQVNDLPLHIRPDEDGDPIAQAVAEIYMTDTTASALINAGLCPLRSVKNEAAVRIPQLISAASSATPVLAAISA